MPPSPRFHLSPIHAAIICATLVVAGCAVRDERPVDELRQRVDQLEKRLSTMSAPVAPVAAHGSAHAIAAHQQPEAAFRALSAGNAAFAAGEQRQPDLSQARRRELAGGQQPVAAIVACADSRCPPEHLFGSGLGDIFVVRCAGNVIDTAAVASLEYAVAHLGVRLIAVVGHDSCGAVKAALADAHDTPAISALVAQIKPALAPGAGDATARAVAANATLQRDELLKGSELLAGMARSREVRVVVGVQSLATGTVAWLDKDGLASGPVAPTTAKPQPAPAAHGH
jgi:carbonic anhydrase